MEDIWTTRVTTHLKPKSLALYLTFLGRGIGSLIFLRVIGSADSYNYFCFLQLAWFSLCWFLSLSPLFRYRIGTLLQCLSWFPQLLSKLYLISLFVIGPSRFSLLDPITYFIFHLKWFFVCHELRLLNKKIKYKKIVRIQNLLHSYVSKKENF